jgi:hypothetical protein
MLPALRVELPGIPEPILKDTLYRVIRQFFWESEAWKYTYDNGLDWTQDQLTLEAPTPDTIKYDAGGDSWDTPIPFKTRDELDRENPDWRTETGTSPSAWAHDNDGAAIVVPLVSTTVTTALLIRSVIAPVFTAVTDTLPDFLYYEFEETMKHGVWAQLMKQSGKDWTNKQQGDVYANAFFQGIIKAKSRAQSDFGQPKDTMAYGGL